MFLMPSFHAIRPVLAVFGSANSLLAPLPHNMQGAVICLGNFDGFHLGHQVLLDEAGKLARTNGRRLALMSCEPHPRSFFAPIGHAPFRLASPVQKRILLGDMPVDYLFEPSFDANFSSLTPEQFLRLVLLGHLHIGGIVCGADFRFGKDRKGDTEVISAFCAAEGLSFLAVDKALPASSTAARTALMDHDFANAQKILGRDWQIDLRAQGVQMRPPAGRYLAETRGNTAKVEVEIRADGSTNADPVRHGRFLNLMGLA